MTNTGTSTLTVNSISFTGKDPNDFYQHNACGSSLAARASCTISVLFRPNCPGTRTASLSVADNAAGSPQTTTLTGTGTVVSLSATSINFGSVVVGQTSAPNSFTLTNVGSIALPISKIAITGADPQDFAQRNTCGTSVAAGASCSISVTFTPTVKGSRSAAVSIYDGGGDSPQSVNLSGTGT